MNRQIINGLKALADGKAVGYHRLGEIVIRVTSGGFLVDEVDAWRDGDTAPTYQGRVEPGGGHGLWRAMTANGKAHNKTDVMRQHSAGLDYVSALAIVVAHRSQRPVKQPWDEQAAARAVTVVAVDATAVDATAEGSDPSEALILLPHSGLRVPHARLAVTSLKQLETSRGVSFTATLRLDGKIVGSIENEGCGGETMFQPRHGAGFGYDELNQFAKQCRAASGWTSTEAVIDDLVDEYETARLITRAAKAGKLTCRLLSRIADDSTDTHATHHGTIKAKHAPRTSKQRDQLGDICQRLSPAVPGRSCWQVWDADVQQWIDLPNLDAQAGSEAGK